MHDLLLVWKMESQRLLRHRGFLFLALAWPVVFAFFFGSIYTDRVVNSMPIAIVDMDHSTLSRTLVRFIGTNRSFKISETFVSPENTKDRFLRGDFAATVIIPRHFQRDIKRGHRTSVTVWVNATNVVVANLTMSEMAYIVGTINGGIQMKFLQKTGSSSARAMELIQPLPLNIAKLYNSGLNYMNYLTPGIWAAILHQVIILLGALCFVPHFQRQETQGLISRVRSRYSLFWGKWSFYFILGLVSFEVFFRVLFPIFDIAVHSSVISLLLFSALLCAAALSLGCLISLASSRTIGAMKGVLLLASPAFILSGYTFPIEQMPAVYKILTAIFPLTPFVSGYRKIYQEGVGLEYVLPEVRHLALLIVIYTAASLILFARRWRSA
ncbi:ABC transporter permease [Bdellovibrio bacteriovorus]|uniref:ABC transporter permease n=1 Tax=Bdellovibrio bacteriovorus TaxID=959 RepID=UPI0035A61458